MASWLVREKSAPVVTVELLEKATRLPKTADSRPPLPGMERATLRRTLFALVAPRQNPADPPSPRRASSRPRLLGVRQVRAQLRRVLFALPA